MEGCEELCTQLYIQICKQMFHRTRLFSVIHNTITDLILWTLDLMNFENEFNSYNNVKFKVNKSTFTFILFMLHVILTNGIRSNLKEIDMIDDLCGIPVPGRSAQGLCCMRFRKGVVCVLER